MKRVLTTLSRGLAATVLAAGVFGCGGSAHNEQGASVTLAGIFQNSTCTTGFAGGYFTLGTDSGDGGAVGQLEFYSVQNNLVNVGFRTERLFFRFFVEGASEQPPETTIAIGAVLGPASRENPGAGGGGGSSSAGNGSGSLPPGFNLPNKTCSQNFVVPPETIAWLSLNRNSLPEPPFTMTVEVSLTGVTTAGDRIDTNSIAVPAIFITDNPINPDGGSASSDASSSSAP